MAKRAKTELFAQWYGGKSLHLASQTISTGDRFFVGNAEADNSDTVGYGSSPLAPFATLDYAIGQCTAENDDIIIVMENHAETLAAAAAVVCDIQGVTIQGVGNGSDRPTFTFDTDVNADWDIDAANVVIRNIKFINTMDALVAAFDVNAMYCTIEDCEFIDDGADNTLLWISGDANADSLVVKNCLNRGTDTAGNTAFITMAAASNYQIIGLISNGDFAAANIDMSAASVDCLIEGCRLQNSNAVDVCIEGFAAATGWVVENYMFIATDTILTAINTVGALALFQNYLVNVGGETGILVGTPSG